jgi:hypothetical protein
MTMFLRVVLLIALAATASAGIFSRLNIFRKALKERTLLPTLAPHEDTSYIIEFVTDSSDTVDQMDAVVERLERDCNLKVRKVNINRKAEYYTAFECTGGSECGNVPFFWNRRTGQAICGPTNYLNLKRLAEGCPDCLFHDAPQNMSERHEYMGPRMRGGLPEFMNDQIGKGNKAATKGKKGKKGKGKKGPKDLTPDRSAASPPSSIPAAVF